MHALTASLLLAIPAALPFQPQDPPIPADISPVTTASGLKYSVLERGAGVEKPKMGDKVTVHYTGWLEDGKVFDSSVQRGTPATFTLGQVIQGWNEGMQLMNVGAKFKFTIPPDLGYGPSGSPPAVPPNATLIFEVELIRVTPGPKLPELASGKMTATESGLRYMMVKEGEGEKPDFGEVVDLKYALWDMNGRLLDCSEFQGGRTIKMPVEQMPLGFLKEAPLLMAPGSVFQFEVPPALGFGAQARGTIPANSTTIWQLTLVRVVRPMPVPEFVSPVGADQQTTSSGLKYEVLEKGEGTKPRMGEQVIVHYAGWLPDGTLFDSSYDRGEPATFILGNVIQGWNEGLQLMSPGAVYRFYIPSRLAYGPSGSPPKIGRDQDLVFLVTLEEVRGG